MKRIFSVILIVFLVTGLLGCSNSEPGPETAASAGTESLEGTGAMTETVPEGSQASAETEDGQDWIPEEETFAEAAPSEEYQVISIEEYLEKTTSGFLGQLVGTLSGYEFVWGSDGNLRIALPDSWFEICNGPYANHNIHYANIIEDKLLMNEETGVWEVWTDDDYHVDILNQYILADAFAQYGTFSSKVIKDGWVNYDVWDMGGGHRTVGAYGLMSKKDYLPVFSGSAEFGNAGNWVTEAYIETETIGMSAAGLPNVAADMADVFAGVTSDCEPALWARFLVTMYSLAYFEDDVPTLIREAQKVLPEGGWQSQVIDQVFAIKEKYPDSWRDACPEIESSCRRMHYQMEETLQCEPNVNNAFVLMALLYGDGDYYETCKIASLAGYDGDCTAAEALGVVGIIQGMKDLPSEVNEMIWQDGKGVVVNSYNPEMPSMYYMCCTGLPERIPMKDIVALYQQNFEHILLENGGKIEDGNYYIPKEALRSAETILFEDFEHGLDDWTVTGDVELSEPGCTGEYSAQVNYSEDQDCGISRELTGLIPGAKYEVTVYVNSSPRTIAYLFAREPGMEDGAYEIAGGYNHSYVKRDFIFRATAETMEIGLVVPSGMSLSRNSKIDNITVSHILEQKPLGDAVKIELQEEEKSLIKMEISGKCEREVYLKLTFSNSSYNIVDTKMTLNGEEYACIPFYGMGETNRPQTPDNFVYVPVILNREVNEVTLDLRSGAEVLDILGAEIVSCRDRW